MLNNIAFIGGVHGVGKSTLCKKICDEVRLEYLSASDLLKWTEINNDDRNKKVKDIPATQERLIHGLTNTIDKNVSYLLDGHYCLLNKQNDIVKIPLSTFQKISPISFNIIIGDVSEIKSRLEIRDERPYNYDLLNLMQETELNYAKDLSENLGVPLNIGTQNDISELLASLRKTFHGK